MDDFSAFDMSHERPFSSFIFWHIPSKRMEVESFQLKNLLFNT